MTPEYSIELLDSRLLGIGPRRWWWRVVHRNSQVLLVSETYVRRQDRDQVAWNLYRAMAPGAASEPRAVTREELDARLDDLM